MYILVIRNHQESAWLHFVHKGFHFGQTLFIESKNEIETDKDAFETITIIIKATNILDACFKLISIDRIKITYKME
jgi:hypothetical protein